MKLVRGLKDINARIKIIASTGQDTESRRAELLALGVPEILKKPYGSDDLLAALHAALHSQHTKPKRS